MNTNQKRSRLQLFRYDKSQFISLEDLFFTFCYSLYKHCKIIKTYENIHTKSTGSSSLCKDYYVLLKLRFDHRIGDHITS